MKFFNVTSKICLLVALLLTGGILIVQAAGFVSYEDNDKIFLWDNVRMVGSGLKVSNFGINDNELLPAGAIKTESKDLYLRNMIGFDCSNYPLETDCQTMIGNVGGQAFLIIDSIGKSSQPINFISENSGILLGGDSINMSGKLTLTDNKNLIVTDKTLPVDAVTGNPLPNSVYVSELIVQEIKNTPGDDNLEMPATLLLSIGTVFNPKRVIDLDLSTP
jgi:hypothetical protein